MITFRMPRPASSLGHRPSWQVRLGLVLLLGAGIRFLLLFLEPDQFDIGIMQAWARALATSPWGEFYGLDTGIPTDHLPGDLWILIALGKLKDVVAPGLGEPQVPRWYLIKGVACLADLMIAGCIFAICRRLEPSRDALLPTVAFLFSPAVIVISVIWGQWDALSSGFLLLAFHALIRYPQGALAAWPLLAYACLIKPQLGIVAPFLLIYQWKRGGVRETGQALIGMVLAVVVARSVLAPFQVGLPGDSLEWPLTQIIERSVDQYRQVALGAHNLWSLVYAQDLPVDDTRTASWGLTYQATGMILFVGGYLTCLAIASRIQNYTIGLFWGSSAAMMTLFMFQTRMHERYLFPTLPLLLIAAYLAPALRGPAILLQVTFFLNLASAYTYVRPAYRLPGLHEDLFVRIVSLTNLAILGATIWIGASLGRQVLTPRRSGLDPGGTSASVARRDDYGSSSAPEGLTTL